MPLRTRCQWYCAVDNCSVLCYILCSCTIHCAIHFPYGRRAQSVWSNIGGGMAAYRIVCTTQEPVYQPTTHAHIVAVGTGTDPNKADQKWTLAEVLDAMKRGDTFYTISPSTGKRAEVRSEPCGSCRRTIIRSAPDAVRDNNLDNLRLCNWS